MKRKFCFCLLLPVMVLLLSLSLDKIGDSQRTRLVRANVGRYGYREDLPSYYAIARYMDYGLNSPAWLLSQKLPSILPQNMDAACCGFIRGETDWEYFSLVVLTWFLIGTQLGKRGTYQRTDKSVRGVWLRWVLRSLCGIYGLFLCYSAVELYLVPTWNYPRWVVVPVALWGGLLVFGSLYPLSLSRLKTWHRILGVAVATAGVFYCEAAVQLFRFRSSFGVSTVALLSIWGIAAIIGGVYLLVRSRKLVKQPV
jgi:hypothetical protein